MLDLKLISSKHISKARDAQGLSLEEAAHLITEASGVEVSRQRLENWEMAYREASNEMIVAMAKVFNVDPGYLAGFSQNPELNPAASFVLPSTTDSSKNGGLHLVKGGGETVPMNFSVPAELRTEFRLAATNYGVSMTTIVKESFELWKKQKGGA